jgi:hypothetical protein
MKKRFWLRSPADEGLVAAWHLIAIFLHACAFRGGQVGASWGLLGLCNFTLEDGIYCYRCPLSEPLIPTSMGAINVPRTFSNKSIRYYTFLL